MCYLEMVRLKRY